MKTPVKALLLLTLSLVFIIISCGRFQPQSQKPAVSGKDGKSDAWDYRNDPDRLNMSLNYKLGELPKRGESEKTPWPGDYWATYKDSTNHRWQRGELSPLEKYDMAFNDWRPSESFMSLEPFNPATCNDFDEEYYDRLGPAAKYQSRNKGNAKARNGRDDDDDGEADECGDHDGVETWWGLCHAWVPAAILEDEPQHAAVYNGVTFEVSDIKALLMTAYDKSSAIIVGGRCNEKEVERDDNGRLTQSQCRDTNAGTFHVVITNILGVQKRALAEDRTYNYQVWNQPIRSYKVDKMDEINLEKALSLLGVEGTSYPFNDKAKRFFEVRMNVDYITESSPSKEPMIPSIDRYTRTDRYHYLLELDERENIIGGEWLGSSRENHPDFLWVPLSAQESGNPHLSLENVRMLLELSRQDPQEDGEAIKHSNNEERPIPDNDAAGITSVINVPDSGSIASLKVKIEITHSYIGDLQIELRREGQRVLLHGRQGGSQSNINETYAVVEFNGMDVSGEWTLHISDNAKRDEGKLKSWSLLLTTGTPSGTIRTLTSNDRVNIPDNDADGVTGEISTTESGTVKSLRVKVDIKHDYIGDLIVKLRHNDMIRTLHNRQGGSEGDLVTTYNVTEFNGMSLSGKWELMVSDNARSDEGHVENWSLVAATE